MAYLSVDRVAIVALETYTRYFSRVLRDLQHGATLAPSQRQQFAAAEEIIDRLLVALGDEGSFDHGSTFGVAFPADDTYDASLLYALKAWKEDGKPTNSGAVHRRLHTYKRQLAKVRKGKTTEADKPALAELTTFFAGFNRAIEVYAGV